MKLTVKNFGPIHEAKNIDVGPMTIFVGPSNTGKSYLAILIYSIMKTLGESVTWYGHSVVHRYALQKVIEESYAEKVETYKSKKNVMIRIDELFYSWAEVISRDWKEQVVYCFGEVGENMMATDNNNLAVKISDEHGKLILDLSSPSNSKLSHQQKKELYERVNISVEGFAQVLKRYRNAGSAEAKKHFVFRVESAFSEITHQFLSMLLPQQDKTGDAQIESHYLPAIRGGIMQSHRTLVSALIQRAPMAGLGEMASISLFTGVLSDFMEKLIRVRGADRRSMRSRPRSKVPSNDVRTEIRRISGEVETEIMEGKINIQMSEVRYPDFRYVFERGGREYDLPLMGVSSMVSELAPISLFIRYYLNPGDLFIVEEPEAHLHPAAQRDISRILVQLVNAGVHVLVTTHSDDILENIGNFIHAAEINKKIKGQALEKEKISVYLFDRLKKSRHENTVVKKVPFDDDTGILTKDHLDSSLSLYNETVGLLEEKEKGND